MQLSGVEIQEGARDVCLHNASMTYMPLWYYVTCTLLHHTYITHFNIHET